MARREEVGIDLTARDRGATARVDQLGNAIDRVDRKAGMTSRTFGRMGGALDKVTSGIFMGVGMAAYQQVENAVGMVTGGIIGMNASLEVSTLQFETLMGDADRAKSHVESLFDFAAKTPFETGPIIEASRMMQTFGGDSLNTMENLTLVGDAAAASTAPINELAFWVGRAYSSIQSGRPFGEAAMRLQELAVLSPQARNEMEALQKSGASAAEVWAVMERDLGRFSGAMVKQAGTWGGLTSSIQDNVAILSSTTFKPVFDTAKAGMTDLLAFLSTPEMQRGAENFAAILGEQINPERLRAGVDGLADAIARVDFQSLSEDGQAFASAFVQFARDVPWSTLGQAMSLAGEATRMALEVFNQLPGPVKTALIGAFAVNKLTGGALTTLTNKAVGAAAGGGGLLFGGRGVSPAAPMYVMDVAGGGNADIMGDRMGTKVGKAIGVAMAAATALSVAAIANELDGPLNDLGSDIHEGLFGKDNPLADIGEMWGQWQADLNWPWGTKGMPDWARFGPPPVSPEAAATGGSLRAGIDQTIDSIGSFADRNRDGAWYSRQVQAVEPIKVPVEVDQQSVAKLPGDIASAIRERRSEVDAAFAQLKSDLETFGPDREDVRTIGYLISQDLVSGLDHGDNLIKQSARSAQDTFLTYLGELVGDSGELSKDAMDALNKGINDKNPEVRRQARRVKELVENGLLPTKADDAGKKAVNDVNAALVNGGSRLGTTAEQLGRTIGYGIIAGVRNSVGAASPDAPQPTRPVRHFAVGAWQVNRDQLAMVHADEMILPADFARRVRGDGYVSPRVGMAAGAGGGTVYITNHYGRGAVRRDQDIREIGKEQALQARLQGLRVRPGVTGGDA